MGCVCCSLRKCFSTLFGAIEKISLSTVCAMLTWCLYFTILMVLSTGVGIGYHYCFVQHTVKTIERENAQVIGKPDMRIAKRILETEEHAAQLEADRKALRESKEQAAVEKAAQQVDRKKLADEQAAHEVAKQEMAIRQAAYQKAVQEMQAAKQELATEQARLEHLLKKLQVAQEGNLISAKLRPT